MWMLCWCSCFCSSAQFYGQSWETVWSRVCPTFPSGTDSPITADCWPVHIWPIRGLYKQNWPIGCHKTVILRQVMNNLVLVWWPDSPGSLHDHWHWTMQEPGQEPQPSNKLGVRGRLTGSNLGQDCHEFCEVHIQSFKLHASWMMSN